MLKRTLIILTALLFAAAGASCSLTASTTQKYLKAYERTIEAGTMELKTDCIIKLDLSKASDDTRSKLEKFKEISLNIDEKTDNKNSKGEMRIFLNAGEFIMDSTFYFNNGKSFMKSSFTGDKYADFGSFTEKPYGDEQKKTYEGYEILFNKMSGTWKKAVENEVLESEGNSIKNTPDGDIKVRHLSLRLTDEKAKNILRKLAESIAADEELVKLLTESGMENIQGNIREEQKRNIVEEWVRKLPENIGKLEDKYTVEELKMSAWIDRDYYIIDEVITGIVIIKEAGDIKIDFSVSTTRWNINRPVRIEVPEVNESDMESMDSFYSGFVKKYMNPADSR